jgi:hypothetical protein
MQGIRDLVVAEHRVPIAWAGLAEIARIYVLRVYVEGLLDSPAMAASDGRPALPAND